MHDSFLLVFFIVAAFDALTLENKEAGSPMSSLKTSKYTTGHRNWVRNSDLAQTCHLKNICIKHPEKVGTSSILWEDLCLLEKIPSKSQKLQPSMGFFPVVSSGFSTFWFQFLI